MDDLIISVFYGIDNFCKKFIPYMEQKCIQTDDNAAQEYGHIRADLQQKGIPIGPMDMLIASHAKALGITIVTNNTNEFKRINGLELEDWL